jgi:hypothetical protein
VAEPGICPVKDAAAAVVECSGAELRLAVVITYRCEHDDSNQKVAVSLCKDLWQNNTFTHSFPLVQSQRRFTGGP